MFSSSGILAGNNLGFISCTVQPVPWPAQVNLLILGILVKIFFLYNPIYIIEFQNEK